MSAIRPDARAPSGRAQSEADAEQATVANSSIWVSAAGALGLVALGFAWALLPLDEWMLQFSRWVNGYGVIGIATVFFSYTLGTLLLIPGTPLSVAAGVAYGWWALPLVMVGAVISATLSFVIARYLLRARVERMLKERPQLRAAEHAVNEDGWKVVALIRLSPVIPFAAQNYFFGVTGVPLLTYVVVSTIAMVPGAVLHVYAGVLGRGAAEGAGSVAGWVFLVVGIIATILVTVLVAHKTRAKLREYGAEQ